jgi:hypothetical protein
MLVASVEASEPSQESCVQIIDVCGRAASVSSFQLFRQHGCRVAACDDFWNTALSVAKSRGLTKIIKALL